MQYEYMCCYSNTSAHAMSCFPFKRNTYPTLKNAPTNTNIFKNYENKSYNARERDKMANKCNYSLQSRQYIVGTM